MTQQATGTIETTSWTEETWNEAADGAKLTRAQVECRWRGDIAGNSVQTYLMTYRPDGIADFIGLERISGQLGGRSGSIVVEHHGRTTENGIDATWTVVAGSGSGEWHLLRGNGSYRWRSEDGSMTRYSFDYEWEAA